MHALMVTMKDTTGSKYPLKPNLLLMDLSSKSWGARRQKYIFDWLTYECSLTVGSKRDIQLISVLTPVVEEVANVWLHADKNLSYNPCRDVY